MASKDGDATAVRSRTGEAENSASATSRFTVREPVPHWNVAEFKRLYPSTLDTRRFLAMFSDGRNATMFDCMGVRRDTDIGVWERRWASFGSWCAGIMDPIGRSDMPFVRHADEVSYVRSLRWVMCSSENDWPAMGMLDLVCLAKRITNFISSKTRMTGVVSWTLSGVTWMAQSRCVRVTWTWAKRVLRGCTQGLLYL